MIWLGSFFAHVVYFGNLMAGSIFGWNLFDRDPFTHAFTVFMLYIMSIETVNNEETTRESEKPRDDEVDIATPLNGSYCVLLKYRHQATIACKCNVSNREIKM